MTTVDALSDLTSPAFTYAKDAIYVPREPCATTGEHGNVIEYRTYNGDAEVTFAGPTRFCNDCYTWLDKASPGEERGTNEEAAGGGAAAHDGDIPRREVSAVHASA